MKEGDVIKIMLVNFYHVINSQGGAERVLCNMANELICRGYDVSICIAENENGLPFFALDSSVNFINVGIGLSRDLSFTEKIKRSMFFCRKDRHTFTENLVDMRLVSRVRPVVKEVNPDVIISFSADATRVLYKSVGVYYPVITMCHSTPEIYLSNCSHDTIKAVEQYQCFQVLMPSFCKKAKKYINNKTIVCIPNAVNIYPKDNLIKQKLIVNVGRISRNEKRQHIAIEAFNMIHKDFPDWRMEFYGEIMEPDYFDYCNELIRKYKLSDKVIYRGITNNIINVLGISSVFCFPSAYEGFGLALAEAMSSGLACIGFKNSPGVNELIVDGSNGILCDDGIDNFAKGLHELLSDKDKRDTYGAQARADMQKYSPNRVWDEWDVLINDIATKHMMK